MKTLLTLCSLLTALGWLTAQTNKGASPLNPQSAIANPQSVRAVVIGISDYADDRIPDLRFAHVDAQAFADYLRSPAGGSLPNDQLMLLTNVQATAGKIIAALTWLIEECKSGERAIIYFSGHGDVEQVTKFQRGYLLAHDSPGTTYMAGGSLPVGFLSDVITTLSEAGVDIVMVSDACRSGKLAGSANGGTQATSAALAQQFSKEIKILSCQPEEFSLEGEQWGGGRGCFSFHLVDALTGMADGNADGSVNLLEAGRYLEDRVPAETAPHSQIPMTVGNRSTSLATVQPEALAVLRQRKTGQVSTLSPIDAKGFEDMVLAKADSPVQQLYAAFTAALDRGDLMAPAGASANDYYLRLLPEPGIEKLKGLMTRNLAAALQDEAQVVINQMLRTDPQIVDDAFSPVSKYDHLPGYLHRAGELLGEGHYMYRFIKAREYYFRAKACRKENYPDLAPDSLLKLALARLDTALVFDEEAAYAWFDKGYLLFWGSQIPQSVQYFEKAEHASPFWFLPKYYSARALVHGDIDYENGMSKLKNLVAEDSSFLPLYRDIGVSVKDGQIWFETYIRKMNEYLSANPQQVPATYFNYLGSSLMQLNRNEEAVQALLTGADLSIQQHPLIYVNLARAYSAMGRYEDAEATYEKSVELSPLNFTIYFELGVLKRVYLDRPPQEVIDCFSKVVQLLPNHWPAWIELTAVYLQSGQLDSAEQVSRQFIFANPNIQAAYLQLGQVLRLQGKMDASRQQFEKVLTLADEDAVFDMYYKLFALAGLGIKDSFDIATKNFRTALSDDADYYFSLAIVHVFNMQNDLALEFLEKAFINGWKPDPNDDSNSFNHSELYMLRQTPEFKALVKKYFPNQVKD